MDIARPGRVSRGRAGVDGLEAAAGREVRRPRGDPGRAQRVISRLGTRRPRLSVITPSLTRIWLTS